MAGRIPVVLFVLVVVLSMAGHMVVVSIHESNPHDLAGIIHVNKTNYYFVIYGSSACPHCRAMHQFLIDKYGASKVYFCDSYTNSTCMDRMNEISSELGSDVFQYIPQTYIVVNCTLSAIIIGEAENEGFINSLLHPNPGRNVKIPVYMGNGVTGGSLYGYVHLENQYSFISRYLSYNGTCSYEEKGGVGGSVERVYSITDLLPALVFLSLIDSVNPCTMTLYFLFLASLLSGKHGITGPGLLFIAVIYAGYLLLGLGLASLTRIMDARILVGLGILAGIYNVYDAGKRSGEEKIKCRMCRRLPGFPGGSRPFLEALLLSLICVGVLLPCTSGPLLVFTGLLAGYPVGIVIAALMAYTLIFTAPLLLIFWSARSLGKTSRVEKFLSKHAGAVEFFTGILIILIGVFILL